MRSRRPTAEQLVRVAERELEALTPSLPREVRDAVAEVAVLLEDYPDPEFLGDAFDPSILGVFAGEAHGETGETAVPSPPCIYLFAGNLWEEAEGSWRRFRQEVRVTYLHELGHYLGWDEDELARRGIE